jgi:hypothetical protein
MEREILKLKEQAFALSRIIKDTFLKLYSGLPVHIITGVQRAGWLDIDSH